MKHAVQEISVFRLRRYFNLFECGSAVMNALVFIHLTKAGILTINEFGTECLTPHLINDSHEWTDLFLMEYYLHTMKPAVVAARYSWNTLTYCRLYVLSEFCQILCFHARITSNLIYMSLQQSELLLLIDNIEKIPYYPYIIRQFTDECVRVYNIYAAIFGKLTYFCWMCVLH